MKPETASMQTRLVAMCLGPEGGGGLEPIFEADLPSELYAYRPGRNAQQAVVEVEELLFRGHPEVVDADLADYFGSIPHAELLKSVARRIGFDIREVPRRNPGPDEVEIAVEAASVNPIDVRRAAGYGRRLLSLMGASRFPMTLGNDFAGVVAAVGSGRASGFAIGERVYGVKPPSREGTHSSHVLVKAAHTRKATANRELQDLAALPYSFVTMWLAAAGAGVTRQNAEGKEILVHGAAGGLGRLALQTLSAWGAQVTAVAKASDLPGCLEAGAVEAVERERNPFANMRGAFDATLNFATWDDEARLLSCLREGALGQATTVHPLVQSFDERGWIGGALGVVQQKRKMRAALPRGARNYAWILFRSETEALSEMARLVELGRLSLPIGIRAPLREAAKAFDHMRRHAPGRALLIP